MERGIYAIYDNKTGDIVSNYLVIHNHVAAAIRMFQDVASSPQSSIRQHAEDFDLIQLGTLSEGAITPFHRIVHIDGTPTLKPHYELIMSGTALMAAQPRESLSLEK